MDRGTDPYHGSHGYGSNGLPDSNATLTWTADGRRLAFVYSGSKGPGASVLLREVDLAAPGGDLFKDSSVIARIGVSATTGRSKIWCDSLGITGDGRTVVCGAELPKAPPVGASLDALTSPDPWTGCAAPTDLAYPGIAEIALSGDRLARVLYQVTPACAGSGFTTVLWSSPSGGTVLAAVDYHGGPLADRAPGRPLRPRQGHGAGLAGRGEHAGSPDGRLLTVTGPVTSRPSPSRRP